MIKQTINYENSIKIIVDSFSDESRYSISEKFKPVFDKYTDELERIFQPLVSKIDELTRELDQISNDCANPLREAGFWIPPIVSKNFMIKLREICISEECSKTSIRKYFVDSFEENNYELMECMVDSWRYKKHYSIRMPIINEALNAHKEGKYYLSIPTLIPMVEGILIGIAGKSNKEAGQKISEFAGEMINENYFDGMRESVKDIILSFITESSFYSFAPSNNIDEFKKWVQERNLEENQFLNRHAILHGIHINYASVENSLRLFLLLDSLSEIDDMRFYNKIHPK